MAKHGKRYDTAKAQIKPEGSYAPLDAFRLLLIGPILDAVLNPATGQPVEGFGEHGKVNSGECRIAPAIYQHALVIAGYLGNLYGFDVLSGAPLALGDDPGSAAGQHLLAHEVAHGVVVGEDRGGARADADRKSVV